LAQARGGGFFLRLYIKSPASARMAETAYAYVARHRHFFSAITRIFFDREAPRYTALATFFIRGLGLIYLCAFASLWQQLPGLIGNDGIEPVSRTLRAIETQALGIQKYFSVPHALLVQCQ